MRDGPTLDEKAFVKVKPKHPGKDDPLQSHTDKDYIIAKQGQEPELVPKPMPGPDQEPVLDIKSEQGP